MVIRTRKTKIVATIGPATAYPEKIKSLIRAGVNVFRLNFSHGDHEFHGQVIDFIREIEASENCCVGILQDLSGPKIRLGYLPEEEILLETGSTVFLVPSSTSKSRDVLPIDYEYLLDDVSEGDRILVSDGTIELVVTKKADSKLVATVVVGGTVRSHKGVNLPSGGFKLKAFTEKDEADLDFGLKKGIDFVAMSFVRHEKDVIPVLERINSSENRPFLIAKIEKPQAVERLNSILEVVDGVMVARGDLGVEMSLEKIPISQKMIIRSAISKAKPVITATQMLRSMTTNPRPTRAETTDVANAIFDGTDALMLSEETATGRYPVETVMAMDKIAREAEKHLDEFFRRPEAHLHMNSIEEAIGWSAWMLANELQTVAIVASTDLGTTARLVSRFRPRTPIIAITHKISTYRQLSLSWGVVPVLTGKFKDTDDMFSVARKMVEDTGIARKGDNIVITAGVPVGVSGTTNVVKVVKV